MTDSTSDRRRTGEEKFQSRDRIPGKVVRVSLCGPGVRDSGLLVLVGLPNLSRTEEVKGVGRVSGLRSPRLQMFNVD